MAAGLPSASEVQPALLPLETALQRHRDHGEPFAVLACDFRNNCDADAEEAMSALLLRNPSDSVVQLGKTCFLLLPGATTGQMARRAAALQESAYDGALLVPAAIGSAHSSEGIETGEALLARAERRMHRPTRETLTPAVGIS